MCPTRVRVDQIFLFPARSHQTDLHLVLFLCLRNETKDFAPQAAAVVKNSTVFFVHVAAFVPFSPPREGEVFTL